VHGSGIVGNAIKVRLRSGEVERFCASGFVDSRCYRSDQDCKNFLPESPLQPAPSGLGFALFLTPRLRDGEGGYCGCPTIKLLILWQLEFE
jgi:hypothetical protein